MKDIHARVQKAKNLQRRAPEIGREFATRIFEEILQGEEMIDAVQELAVEQEGIEITYLINEDLDEIETVYVDIVWDNTIAQLQRLIEENRTITRNKPNPVK